MNRIIAYQNASAIMSYLIGTGVGSIISIDVFTLMVQLHVHLPRKLFKVADVHKMINPLLVGSPKFRVQTLKEKNVNVLDIEWGDFDE